MDGERTAPRLSGVAVFFYVFLPFALGHYLSSLLRNVNAVLAPNLVGSLSLGTAELGLLTSAFFFSFALVQLPVGIALDRYGPRMVQLVLMLVAALGALLFATGTSFAQLVVARAVIGLGLGGCFMSAVKAISTWISPAKLPSVHGYLIAVGGLGAASATLAGAAGAALHRLARPVRPARRADRLRRPADLAGHAAQRRAGQRQDADRAVDPRRLPRSRVPQDHLADAGAAHDLLRHPGPVDRALAVRRRAFFGRRGGLPAVPEHGGGDLRRHRASAW